MTKGLIRSLSRGPKARREIVTERIQFATDPFNAQTILSGTGGGGIGIAPLPEGNLLLLGAVCEVVIRGNGAEPNLVDTWNGDFAFGTELTTPGASLVGSEVDIVPITPIGPAVGEVSPLTRGTTLATDTGRIIDNTDGLLEIFLNLQIDNADQTDDTTVAMEAEGQLNLTYVVLGDD